MSAGPVVLGGTFDHLHAGHEALLRAAFRMGGPVAIGLTTDRYLSDHPKPGASRIEPYRQRHRALERWLAREFPGRRWRIVPLKDAFGRSVAPGIRTLVVSEETLPGARRVNAMRRRLGRAPVEIVAVPVLLADDLRPVSSRRIRDGTIDGEGRRVGRIRIGVAVRPESLRPSLGTALRRIFPKATFHRRAVPRRHPPVPGPGEDLFVVASAPRSGRKGSLRICSPEVRLRARPWPVGASPDDLVRTTWPPRGPRAESRSLPPKD